MRLIKRGIKTVFCWVPEHEGICDNEQVDRRARKTTEEELGEERSGFQSPYSWSHDGLVAREIVQYEWKQAEGDITKDRAGNFPVSERDGKR